MIDDILASMNKKSPLKTIGVIALLIVAVAMLYFSFLMYVGRTDDGGEQAITNQQPVMSSEQKISIMTKPSGVPVTSNLTNEQKIKIMTGKK